MPICTESNKDTSAPLTAAEARELFEASQEKLIRSSLRETYAAIRRACKLRMREVEVPRFEMGSPEVRERVVEELKRQGFTVEQDHITW